MSNIKCATCHGYGLRPGRNKREVPCNCVLRAIFRACYERFHGCFACDRHLSRVEMEYSDGKDTSRVYSRKNEEYIADFCLVSRNALTPLEYEIFKLHYLSGGEWSHCCRRLGINRGTFFYTAYKLEQKLGRVFRELQPYALFPLYEYFGGRAANRMEICPPKPRRSKVIRPPVAEREAMRA
jgi:hypothetical protein